MEEKIHASRKDECGQVSNIETTSGDKDAWAGGSPVAIKVLPTGYMELLQVDWVERGMQFRLQDIRPQRYKLPLVP